jgi:hypothetical protein
MVGGWGTTVYIEMRGASSEVISLPPLHYGIRIVVSKPLVETPKAFRPKFKMRLGLTILIYVDDAWV